MKKYFIIQFILIAIVSNGYSQKNEENKTQKSNNRTEFMLKKMEADLNLSEKQITELKPIIAEQQAKHETRKTELKAQREEQLEKNKEKMLARKTELLNQQMQFKAKMKTILSAEQYVKWEKTIENKKNRNVRKKKKKMAK